MATAPTHDPPWAAADEPHDASANDSDRETPPQALARTLATRIRGWALQCGATAGSADAAARATWRLSLASSEGHVCITIDDAAQAAALRSSMVIQAHPRPPDDLGPDLPLVLDAQGRLYFHRTFDDEAQLAARLVHAQRHARMPPLSDDVVQTLHSLFNASDREPRAGEPPLDRQRLAVALALTQPVVVVSGGPGTGKTTTLARLLACLRVQDPTLRIGLAAPTGKATARMTAALGADAPSAKTAHAWIGMHPGTGQARHHADDPLPLDVLVVDEASMLDLALARRLLDALPSHARIILLGDKDQLAAVEAGAVFAELASSAATDASTIRRVAPLCGVSLASWPTAPTMHSAAGRSPLGNGVVWLTHNHRFDAGSGIGRLAASVRDGDADTAIDLLQRGENVDLRWVDTGPSNADWPLNLAQGLATFARVHLEPYATAIEDAAHNPSIEATASALQVFERFALLSAVREGPWGMHALNQRMARWLQQRLDRPGDQRAHVAPVRDEASSWYVGRPIMITRNEPTLRLNNGDVGITLPPRGNAPWRVAFALSTGGVVAWPITRLSHVETAFASTVHKAQGSEYPSVAVVLPSPWQRACSRELLYTAITRARSHVTLLASAATLRQCIESKTHRSGGLGERLREAANARHDIG